LVITVPGGYPAQFEVVICHESRNRDAFGHFACSCFRGLTMNPDTVESNQPL
jgi:hypothetical protein